jgi:phosphoribosylanthranilate isomerase
MSVEVKICGVTRPEDAVLAADLGAAYLGLNFYTGSPRHVDLRRARAIAAALAGRVPLVGVFVNHPAAEVEAIAAAVGLDYLQFSGDEEPEHVACFAPRAIKVFRSGGNPGRAALAPYGDAWAWLFDARSAGDGGHGALYGGTGLAWQFGAVAGILGMSGMSGMASRPRIWVAGGVRPGNARRAAADSGAAAIDVCSGVEKAPGIKDSELLARLFEEVRNGQATSPA